MTPELVSWLASLLIGGLGAIATWLAIEWHHERVLREDTLIRLAQVQRELDECKRRFPA